MKDNYPIQLKSNRDEDPAVLKSLESILLSRRGYIIKPPKNENIILLASGGLDSMVSIDLIISKYNSTVYPFFVRRSARATVYEEEALDYFVDFYKRRYPRNFMSPYKLETEVPPIEFKHYKFKNQLITLGHTMRNGVLQSLGFQYKSLLESRDNIQISTILTSTVANDTFPHSCLSALRAENVLACIDGGDWELQITSPLIDPFYEEKPLYKKDLILYAQKNNIPMEKTRTCIEGSKLPDGTCSECVTRLQAFKEAGLKDPLEYQINVY